ncbi:5821_t:CDS:1, partial [Scutellospora calospora]
SEVILVSGSMSFITHIKPFRSSLHMDPKNPEMIIIWEQKEINDNKENVLMAGWIMI